MTLLPIAKAAGDSLAQKIEALALKLEPGLARAVRDLLVSHVAGVDLDAIEDAIKARDIQKVMELIGTTDEVKASKVIEALEEAVWSGGKLGAAASPALTEAHFVFQRLNPALTTWLRGYSLNLIKDIDDKTREAVRGALLRGMTAGDNPIQTARIVKQSVGLTDSMARAVQNYRRELETFHLKTSAKSWGLGNQRSMQSGLPIYEVGEDGKPIDGILARRLRDMRYDSALQRAMETKKPLSPEQINRMVDAYQARYIQDRARNIARTESIRACNVGIHEVWRQAIANGTVEGSLVRKQWVLSASACKVCRAIKKAEPRYGVPLEGWFENPGNEAVKLPPAHPSCRCTTFVRLYEAVQLSNAQEAA